MRTAKLIPSGQMSHFWVLLTLPPPSRDVHEGAVTSSQPSFVLRVTVMATKPTLPSGGTFRGPEEFFGGRDRSFQDPFRDVQTALRVSEGLQSPQVPSTRINKSSLCPSTALAAWAPLDHQERPFAFFPPEASLRSCSSLRLLGYFPAVSWGGTRAEPPP